MPFAEVFKPKQYKRSAQLERLAKANPDKISEYVCDGDGHWLYLHNGWHFEGCAIHAYTVKDCLEDFESIEKESGS